MPRPRLPSRARPSEGGATLVEAALALALIATASLFAIPYVQSVQVRGNEEEARRVLRALVDAEARFLKQNDGRTYATVAELLGESTRRDVVVEPRALTEPGLKRLEAMLQKKGYLFTVYLPPHRSAETASRRPPAYVAYAWPVNAGYSGRLVYVADESGVVRSWTNDRGREVQGFDDPPRPNFAPHPTSAFGDPPTAMRSATWTVAPP